MTSTVTEFGKELLRTGDLDPVYTAIHKAQLDAATLARLCLAYWCFYSLGTAAKLAEIKQPKKFWAAMMTAAVNAGERPDGSKPWPRGSERRHFRGEQAVKAMSELVERYKTPESAVAGFIKPQSGCVYTYASVAASVQTHRGFGEWIAFKIADMSERVMGYDTDFTECHLGIYKDPRQGAAVAYLQREDQRYADVHGNALPVWDYPITDVELSSTVTHYVKTFRTMKLTAPPTGDRLVNVQEIETIFCKYKSHLKGHYPMGKDTLEIGHGLQGWGDLAQQLYKGLPPVQLSLRGVR